MGTIQTIENILYLYTAPRENWWSNHVFFETKKMGVIVYDVPFLNEDGKALWEHIQNHTSGNIALFIVSHGHPDHWASLDYFREVAPDAPILAAEETRVYLYLVGEAQLKWTKMFGTWGERVHTRVPEPTMTFEKEKIIDAGDLTLHLYTTGPAEDTEHTVLYIPELRVLIPNDLIYNQFHPWNEEERDGHWLRVIEWLRTFDAKTIIPGHGPVCGTEIFDAMEKWLCTFQDLRAKYAGRYSIKDISPEARQKMMGELKSTFPDWYDNEIQFSCSHTLAVPYSYGENMYSIGKF